MLRPYIFLPVYRFDALLIRPILVVDDLVHRILATARTPTLLAGMVRNRDHDFSHVVRVVRFLKGMAQPRRRIEETTRVFPARRVGRVRFGPNDVLTRRDDGLPSRAVQHE